MIRHRTRIMSLIAVATITAASCSGSDETSSTTEDLSRRPGDADVVSSPASETTEPVPNVSSTATEPDQSTVPVSEAPDSTEETNTAAPEPEVTESSTTESSEEQAVVDAVEFFEDRWKVCLSTLPNCDQNAASEQRQGEEVTNVQSNAIRWNQNEYRASNIDALDYRVDEVQLDSDAGTAVAVVCVVDPVSLTEADGTVVDDLFYSSIVDWELEQVDGVWTSTRRTTRGEAVVGEENNLCV